jgi:hypothetical protein
MTDVWNAKADALKAAIAADMSKALGREPISDAAVYESLMCSSLDHLVTYAGEDFARLTRNEQQSVVATLLHRLKPDDGIDLHMVGSVPVWLRVVPAVDGRLPSDKPNEWRYVRLDTITEVIPEVAIGTGDDPEEWQYMLSITAGDKKYHPTAVRFRGSAVNAPLTRLLRLVAERVVSREVPAVGSLAGAGAHQ